MNENFETLDGLIEAMYGAVSGPAGPIDARLQRNTYTPGARLIRTSVGEDGFPKKLEMTIDDYLENTRDFFSKNDFYECETTRTVVHCPPFAYVLSEYEGRTSPESDELVLSGVNSIQCFNDGKRWWVSQLIWNHHAAVPQLGG